MTNRADLEKVFFHNYSKQSRVNNPTFISNSVNDSLSLFTPQKPETKEIIRKSEYKSNYEPLKEQVNLTPPAQPHNYARFSKDAYDKSKSFLSQYGTNLLSPTPSRKPLP